LEDDGRVQQKPNILLVLTDQLTPFLTGAYGHPVVKTPSLDRLVANGVRFDAAYCNCPVCAPSRASLMTGQYVSAIGCYDNAAPLACDVPTIAHYLSLAGYDTVASGKMHFIGSDQLHGFRRRLTTNLYPTDFSWVTSREDRGETMFEGKAHASNYALPKVGVRPWSTGLAFDEETQFRALEYLRSRTGTWNTWSTSWEERPFFMCVSYHHPHDPFYVTQDLWDLYEGAEIDLPPVPVDGDVACPAMDTWLKVFWGIDRVPNLWEPESLRAMRRSYYGLVSYVDRKVGELLDALDLVGLRDNTVIVFASDHGDMLGERGLVEKKYFYEWSARVPLIISFPDAWKGGRTCREPVSLLDLLPTVLDIAGVGERLPLEGKSLLGLMDGSEVAPRDVFCEMHTEGVYSTCFMIRRGEYKYTYVHGHDAQLYDLNQDPGECTNLAGLVEYKSVEDDLRSRILDRFDPNQIEEDVRRSLRRRRLLRKAMRVVETSWDYGPEFDASRQYVRGARHKVSD